MSTHTRRGRDPEGDRMSIGRAAVLRGGVVLGAAVSGVALSSAAFLWWGTGAAAVLVVIELIGVMLGLGWLYSTRRPLRFGNVPLIFGVVALFVFNIVGVTAAQHIASTLVGVDAEAVVERTWTTKEKGTDTHHCTLRRTDGTPIPRELGSSCEGHERGDTIPVVLDPKNRLAPIPGPKSDLSTTGELQVVAVAGLVLLASIAIGSVPPQPGNAGPPKRSRT